MPMTLNDYHARVQEISKKFQEDIVAVCTEAVAAELDANILLAIFEAEFSKLGNI
jgi:xanthine dehydrogenase iron-sulfur cluster and FAD-binding subunit A